MMRTTINLDLKERTRLVPETLTADGWPEGVAADLALAFWNL